MKLIFYLNCTLLKIVSSKLKLIAIMKTALSKADNDGAKFIKMVMSSKFSSLNKCLVFTTNHFNQLRSIS